MSNFGNDVLIQYLLNKLAKHGLCHGFSKIPPLLIKTFLFYFIFYFFIFSGVGLYLGQLFNFYNAQYSITVCGPFSAAAAGCPSAPLSSCSAATYCFCCSAAAVAAAALLLQWAAKLLLLFAAGCSSCSAARAAPSCSTAAATAAVAAAADPGQDNSL